MRNQLTAQGIRLGIAVLLASFTGQALAGNYLYDGVTTLCTSTCDGFAALTAPPNGSTLDGSVVIDAGASDTFSFADVGDFSFLVTSPTAPLEEYDGTNPTTANPLPVDSLVAVVEPMNTAGTFVTGGTTDASGQLASGTLLFRFTVAPFSSNDAWVIINVGTGEAKVCLFFDTAGCVSGATESVIIDGSFTLQPSLKLYAQNFETLDMTDPDALIDDGWLIFGNVFDSASNFKFGYGPFGAPNGGSGFSAIDSGQGGVTQGLQQLSIYNDYNCCDLDQPGAEQGHGNGTDLVESNVFEEQSIGLDDVGNTWEFSFDAKLGNLVSPSTALAFIKTLDPDAGFATTNFITVDMTSIGSEWMRYDLSITIDSGLVGQLLQFGYSSTASDFTSSGVFYDNIDFFNVADRDDDGIDNDTDNCTLVANVNQRDTDGDLIGNACDADVDGGANCFVNFLDSQVYVAAFFGNGNVPTPNWNPDTDNNGDNFTNFLDLQLLSAQLFGQPGPSAAGCN